ITILEIIALHFTKIYFLRKSSVNTIKKSINGSIHYKALIIVISLIFFSLTNLNNLLRKHIFVIASMNTVEEQVREISAVFIKWIKVIGLPVLALLLYNSADGEDSVYILTILLFIF